MQVSAEGTQPAVSEHICRPGQRPGPPPFSPSVQSGAVGAVIESA